MIFNSRDLRYLVETHGKTTTLTTKSLGTYDPTTGSVSGGTTATYSVKTYFYNYRLQDIDGQQIVLGDRRAVINLTDTSNVAIPEPEVGDEISGQGDKVSIVSVSKIVSGGTVVCYLAQVRE